MTLEPYLSINELNKVYRSKYGDTLANDNISLTLEKGELLVLLGPNGAGKTTLVRQISTELLPTSGSIRILNHDVVTDPNTVRPLLGVMPQGGSPILHLTTWENLYYFTCLKGFASEKAKIRCNELISALALEEYRNRVTLYLSGGIRRRILFGIAMISNPPLLLLDEPTAGQDPIAKHMIHSMIKETVEKSKQTVLLTTHDLFDVHTLATRIAILHNGQIRFMGSQEELLSKTNADNLFDAFLKTIREGLE